MNLKSYTDYLRYLFPTYVKSNLYRLCYTQVGQTFSICNYWNDPHHHDMYVNSSTYLAPLNSDRPVPNATDWKKNFLRLRKMVLIGGPDDGVITPWESSHFGFYDENETILEMKQQMVYQDDCFGLRSLDYRGGITVYSVPGVTHTLWHSNQTVYKDYIEKWLT
ncbi:lysosomal thioesterase PPT2 [Discoglossus pictus]